MYIYIYIWTHTNVIYIYIGFADNEEVFPVYIGDDRTDEDAFKAWVINISIVYHHVHIYIYIYRDN